MTKDYAFDTPVIHQALNEPIRTIDQAASILRSSLQSQFTMVSLNALLVIERASENGEVAEARQAFCSWASSGLLPQSA